MSLRKAIVLVFVAWLLVGVPSQAVELLKIMPLGDSNTRGTLVGGIGPWPAAIGAGGYRYPLQQMLTAGGYRFDFVGSQTTDAVGEQGDNPPATWVFDPTFDRDHQGLPGFTSDMLIAGGSVPNYPGEETYAPPLVTCLSTCRPDIVLLMSGTNGIGTESNDAHLAALDRVIQTIAINSPGTQVIVSTIFDRWTSAGKDPTTQAYNAGIPALVTAAQERGEHVSFVDTGGVLTRDDFCYNGVLADGVHPNPVLAEPKVAAVWCEGIQRVVPAPEPSTLVLAILGLLALLTYAWRERR